MKAKLFCGLAALALSLAAFVQAADTAPTIKPGALWPDDRGEHINAHGGAFSNSATRGIGSANTDRRTPFPVGATSRVIHPPIS